MYLGKREGLHWTDSDSRCWGNSLILIGAGVGIWFCYRQRQRQRLGAEETTNDTASSPNGSKSPQNKMNYNEMDQA